MESVILLSLSPMERSAALELARPENLKEFLPDTLKGSEVKVTVPVRLVDPLRLYKKELVF